MTEHDDLTERINALTDDQRRLMLVWLSGVAPDALREAFRHRIRMDVVLAFDREAKAGLPPASYGTPCARCGKPFDRGHRCADWPGAEIDNETTKDEQ